MLKNFMHPSTPQADTRSTAHSRTETTRYNPAPESAKPVEPAKTPQSATAAQPGANEDGNKLIVGPNIKLKGSEITDCEILVVEGRVEASMNSRDIRIAEGGVFSGKAEIDVAEVRGHFEGELTARKRLVVYATGKVSGVIRYGAMMVEEGGSISGDVAMLSASNRSGTVTELSKQASDSAQSEASNLELARGKRQL
ncbi:MAG: polymer-forming cytoskeletal protein [Thiobacillus sp.]|nr:polymer-forming cytoskeletal protein [Thiobacillus sp.]